MFLFQRPLHRRNRRPPAHGRCWCRPPSVTESRQLTKRALLSRESEKSRREWGDEVLWRLDRPRRYAEEKRDSNHIGHFPQVHASQLLTRRTESSKSAYLAPQTGFELMTFWLTAIVLDYTDSPERRTGEQVTRCPEVLHLRLLPDAAIRSVG